MFAYFIWTFVHLDGRLQLFVTPYVSVSEQLYSSRSKLLVTRTHSTLVQQTETVSLIQLLFLLICHVWKQSFVILINKPKNWWCHRWRSVVHVLSGTVQFPGTSQPEMLLHIFLDEHSSVKNTSGKLVLSPHTASESLWQFRKALRVKGNKTKKGSNPWLLFFFFNCHLKAEDVLIITLFWLWLLKEKLHKNSLLVKCCLQKRSLSALQKVASLLS